MKYLILTIVVFLLSSCAAKNQNFIVPKQSEISPVNVPNDIPIVKNVHVFGDWTVSIKIDDFEGDVKPNLSSDIYNTKGEVIGVIGIGYFVAPNKRFSSAFVSILIDNLSGAWPACDYEFTKYKIDGSKSKYYPTIGHACPSLIFNKNMANKFKKGSEFRFSASGTTGIVRLSGFNKAWAYTLNRIGE